MNTRISSVASQSMIPYGVRDGRAIHIPSIPHTQKGLSCVCPACGASLVARLGDSRRYHFAHRSLSPNCTAKKAAESGLHLMAKQLIHDNPGIALPGLQINDQRQGFREVLAEAVVVEPPTSGEFEHAYDRYKMAYIVPTSD